MNDYQIAVVVGSLRQDSFNRKLAHAIAKLSPPGFSYKQIRIDDLPLYNQDDDSNPAEPVKTVKGRDRRGTWVAVCHARIQPFNPRRT